MNLLSEACAAVSTPKFHKFIFDERPIQTGLHFGYGRKIPSTSRYGLVPSSEREEERERECKSKNDTLWLTEVKGKQIKRATKQQ